MWRILLVSGIVTVMGLLLFVVMCADWRSDDFRSETAKQHRDEP